jgi:hypothetical protein
VAPAGVVQDVVDVDLSGKAFNAMQARMDKQSSIYQEHRKHAQRRDGEVYASMAAEVFDVAREVKIELPDGTRKTESIMETVLDTKTGEIIVIKDLSNTEFNVYSKITTSFSNQREQDMERIAELMAPLVPGDPMRETLMYEYLSLMNGSGFEDLREYAKNQQILSGIRKPDTPEEQQLLADSQNQQQEPSAEMVLAQAETMMGQAALQKEQRENIKMQLDYQINQQKNQISGFDSQTKRMDTQIDAQEAGAKINKTETEALGQKLDNQAKVIQLRQPAVMSDEDILQEILQG